MPSVWVGMVPTNRRKATLLCKSKMQIYKLGSPSKGEKGMSTKVCTICGQEKDIDEFSNNSGRKDGKLERCKECNRIVQKEEREKKRQNNIKNPPEVPDKLYCSCCKQFLSGELFYRDISRKSGFSNKCKPCSHVLGNIRYKENAESIKSKQREYNLKNKDKLREYNKNRPRPPAKPRSEYNYNCPPHQREKIIECNKNRVWSEESRNKISEKLTGKTHTEESRKKMGESRRGEKNPRWNGGSSFEPYCIKFNNEFKERVRNFFGRKCVVCGKTEQENKCRHVVHHVNYDKNACCNNNKPTFVILCMSCHSRTNPPRLRQYWENRFTELINSKYGGKCYLPKQE